MNNEKIGILFRSLMGISLKTFAKGMDCSPGTICNFEVGRIKSARLEKKYQQLHKHVVDGCKEVVEMLTNEWGEVI